MLKVLLVGQQSKRLLEANRFFRDRGIEVYFMPTPDEKYMRATQRSGCIAAMICSEECEAWKRWMRNHGWKGFVEFS
jgi:hypothetical protein